MKWDTARHRRVCSMLTSMWISLCAPRLCRASFPDIGGTTSAGAAAAAFQASAEPLVLRLLKMHPESAKQRVREQRAQLMLYSAVLLTFFWVGSV
jgi:hypothetical protein